MTGMVDINCAIRLRAIPTRPLPFRGIVNCPAEVRRRHVPDNRGKAPANKGRRYPPTPLTPDEFARLLAVCPNSKAGRRNRALLILLRRSGLRINEALSLIPDDIDHQECTILVREGKGGKTAVCGIDRQALAELEPWLREREKLGARPHEPIFCGVNDGAIGNRMSSGYIRTLLPRLGREAGITKRVAAHQFRHGLAVELARKGVPIPLVSIQLRHSNIGTTATYLKALSPQEAIDVMKGLTW